MNQQPAGQPAPRVDGSTLGLILALLIPSTGVVQRYLGTIGLAAYLVIAGAVLALGRKYGSATLAPRLTERCLRWLTAATFALLLAILLIGYPLANSGRLGGGSDRDDALNIATTALLRGEYPYHAVTYLGNPISPLPGALVLAAPFVMLGSSAYQNFFWLIAFLLTMNVHLRDRRRALCLLWAILALSPVVLQEYVTGGDLLANSLYVFLFVLWLVRIVPRTDVSGWSKAVLAALLGIGLASRANFLLLVPLLLATLVERAGWRPALKSLAITGLTFALLTIPFYLHDPAGFSPLHTTDELGSYEIVLPFAGTLIPLAAGLLALVLAVRRGQRDLLRASAIVLAFPVLCGVILGSIYARWPNFYFAGFGLAFLFFGAARAAQMPDSNRINHRQGGFE